MGTCPAGRDTEVKPHVMEKFRDTMSQMGLSKEQTIMLLKAIKSNRQPLSRVFLARGSLRSALTWSTEVARGRG